MTIHQEGYGFLQRLALILVGLNALVALFFRPRLGISMILSLGVFGFFASFFRKPLRYLPPTEGKIISPADGTIVAIERVRENEFLQDERIQVSIFLSVFNVHMNWIPVDGKVVYYRYHPGEYLVAFHPKSSELNERNTTVIESGGQHILVRQIAGLLARRICCYVETGQAVQAGEELGFIKFGSRVDVFLPVDSQLQVVPYQTVRGGETVLAELPQ